MCKRCEHRQLGTIRTRTSLNVHDTALPLLSTIGRLMTSRPPWNNTSVGSCLVSGEVLTLYLCGRNKGKIRHLNANLLFRQMGGGTLENKTYLSEMSP